MALCTTLGARPATPLVPNFGAIKTLVARLEENREYQYSRLADGVKAPVWVQIREDVPDNHGIEAELKAMGYT